MVKTLSTAAARANFGDVLNGVYYTKEPVVVEKKGKPVAVIISPDQYEALRSQAIERAWATIEAAGARNDDVDSDQLLAEVTEEVEAVRREMAAERRAG